MFTIMLAALLNTVTAASPGAPAATRLPFARTALEVAHTPVDEEHLLKARVAMDELATEALRQQNLDCDSPMY